MVDLAELLRQAASLHRAGNWDEAQQAYRQALAQRPGDAGIRRDLAWLLFARGNRDAAFDELRRAIADGPSAAALENDLGMMLCQSGQVDEAVASFERAIKGDPNLWPAHYNLGNAYQQLRKSAPAAACYERALRHAPGDADVHLNLGVVQTDLGQLEAARASFERALQIRPDFADALINLGIVSKTEGDLERAIDYYRRALAINPASAVAHHNLGLAWRIYNDLEAAVASFEQAVRIDPDYRTAWVNLARAHEARGDATESRACFERALQLGSDDGLRIKSALTIGAMMQSAAQIDQTRQRLARELAALGRENLRVGDPVGTVGAPNFALAYQGRNERETQSQVSAMLLAAAPHLAYVAPHCAVPQARRGGERIKIGFISAHFRMHTIGKLNAGLIEHLNRAAFQVTVFRFPREEDAMSRRIAAAADECVTLAPRLAEAQSEIARRELDVLFYTDIGFDALTYYLAYARLAPVQCVTWGHPLTTGIPTLDYFVSSRDLDPPGAESHYTEKLARLGHLANYYFRPEVSPTKTRRDFGLPGEAHLYASLQSLFKFHPDDDAVFAEILRRDPRGVLVLLEGNYPSWTELLRRRLRGSIPDDFERIVFVPQQTPADFSRLLAVVDVCLDPLHFGGGDTSYQSFAVGAPVVTLPGGFLRGRITYALYRAMGVDDPIARDVDDYVARAVRLGTDSAWRETVRAKILAANHKIFESLAGVRDLEAFLIQAVNAR
jgi:predicted O-linked N-acetylglucosamine transferase (SPINDLY family)